MLIGICGGVCAGKHSVQNFLIDRHAFTPLTLFREDVVETTSTYDYEPLSSPKELSFDSPCALIDYVTAHWQTNFVTASIHDETILDALAQRPFFLLLHIDAPVETRWRRFVCSNPFLSPQPSLEAFLLHSEAHLYSPTHPLAPLRSRANLSLLNTATSLQNLHLALSTLNLPDPARLRPSWDQYFMTLCSLAARRSNCMRRRVGCVLVRARRVISTGYNGTPRHLTNCNEGGCPRCNSTAASTSTQPSGTKGGQDLSTCLCIHAEENALLEAGRERVGSEAVLYCNTCPCLTCSIKIVQVGIAEVVYSQSYYMDAEAARMFAEAGVRLRQFEPPREGLIELGDALAEQGRLMQSSESEKREVGKMGDGVS